MQTMSYSSSDQWPQYYHHRNLYDQQPSIISNSTITPQDYGSNSKRSNSRSDSDGLKPIKRKSRAIKRAPTTIFNADVGNFRALVQQLTGCPIKVVGSRKGPLNIDFAKGNAGNEVDIVSSTMMPFECSNNNKYLVRRSINLKKEENNGNGIVEHEDIVSSSSWQGITTTSSRGMLAQEYPAMNAPAFDDFDVDDLCLDELDWVANAEI